MADIHRFTVVSRMVIGGKVVTPGSTVTLDYDDPQVRGWQLAGNIRILPKKKPAKRKAK